MAQNDREASRNAQVERGEHPEVRKEQYMIDPRSLDVRDDFNIRQDYGDLVELADSIRQVGVREPLKCYRNPDAKGRYIIVSGHRRHRACMIVIKNKWREDLMVPVILEERGATDAERTLDMFLTNDGKSLNILEQANGIKRLVDMQMSEEAIATKLSKSKTHVRNCLLLLTAPADIIELVKDDLIKPTLIITLFKEYGFEKAIRKLRQAIDDVAAQAAQAELAFDEEKPKAKKKITRKDVEEDEQDEIEKEMDEELEDSVGHFKDFLRKIEQNAIDINPDKEDEFTFLRRIINGDVGYDEIQKRYTDM